MPKPFNLFVYGTLMNPSVFRAVIGRRLVLPEEAMKPKDRKPETGPKGAEPAVPSAFGLQPSDYVVARDAVLDGYKKISPDNTYMYAVPDRTPEPGNRQHAAGDRQSAPSSQFPASAVSKACISGYVIGPLPWECMAALRKYEGKNYSRKTLRVHTSEGHVQAVAFIGNLQRMEHSFGYPFRDPLKQEVLLRDKIEAVLLEAEREQLHTDESVARRALGELHGKTIRDLVRQHFDAGGISDYAIRHSLLSEQSADYSEGAEITEGQAHSSASAISVGGAKRSSRLPDFTRIVGDVEARNLAEHYLRMVVRQVIFNQMEEKIRQEFRYELDKMQGQEFYDRAISSLAALRLMNSTKPLMDMLCADCLVLHNPRPQDRKPQQQTAGTGNRKPETGNPELESVAGCPLPVAAVSDVGFAKSHLVDYVRWAVAAADAIYESPWARQQVDFIKTHMGGGVIPMGAELEFSNIGNEVIHDPEGAKLRDLKYDGFLYFADFALDVLTWKLGGHIDDHHEKASTTQRRGFFETALGSLSLEPNLSKPITASPWLLSQLVLETAKFYDIKPHSLHISLQLRSQHRPGASRLLPLYAMKCLFALAGDPGPDEAGRFVIRRLAGDEIVHRPDRVTGEPGSMMFCEISRRHSSDMGEGLATRDPGASGRFVQQFKFLRLSTKINYEPIIVGLKGLQLSLRPGSFLTPAQYKNSPKHRRMFEELLAWGQEPTRISEPEITAFLGHVYDGLISERHGKAVHSEAYIIWALDKLRQMLGDFNRQAVATPRAGASN